MPSLCEHSTPPPRPWTGEDAPLPRSRLNIVRFFALNGRAISFTLSVAKDIFDMRVPRLQITKAGVPDRGTQLKDNTVPESEEEKRALRREIKSWWQGVSDHLDELVSEHRNPVTYVLIPTLYYRRTNSKETSRYFTRLFRDCHPSTRPTKNTVTWRHQRLVLHYKIRHLRVTLRLVYRRRQIFRQPPQVPRIRRNDVQMTLLRRQAGRARWSFSPDYAIHSKRQSRTYIPILVAHPLSS
jgi:hypothetical protein